MARRRRQMSQQQLVALARRAAKQVADGKNDPSPSLLLALIGSESGGDANALSPAGAQGLTQLMPGTARGLGVKNSYDPWQNVLGGARYLEAQLDKFDRPDLALSAYNSGPGGSESSGRVEAFAETQNYVRKVLALAERYSAADKGFDVPSLGKTVEASSGHISDVPSPVPQPEESGMGVSYRDPNQLDLSSIGGLAFTAGVGPLSERVATQEPIEQVAPRPSLAELSGRLSAPEQALVNDLQPGEAAMVEQAAVKGGPMGAKAMLAVIAEARRRNLSVRENPYTDPVDPVHTEGSHHYQTFSGKYNGRRLGRGADISGDPAQMAGLFDWIAKRYPGIPELIYDPRGSIFDGQRSNSPYGGHEGHVHVGF